MATRGRPKVEIDKESFEKLCALQCTLEEIASFFDCSIDTVRRFVKKEYGRSFEEVRVEKSAKGLVSLRRTQFRIAEGGNATMAIWLGKQYLGQRDVQDVKVDQESDFVFNIMPASKAPKSEDEDDE